VKVPLGRLGRDPDREMGLFLNKSVSEYPSIFIYLVFTCFF